jgi:hypothetical protein
MKLGKIKNKGVNTMNNKPKYRIDNKNNVNYGGPKTSFHIYELQYNQLGQGTYVFLTRSFAKGYDANDDKCIKTYLDEE